jgi:hypothetical protein
MGNGCYWVWYCFYDRTGEVIGNNLTQTEIVDDYIYSVPYIEDDEKIFFKTIIPNRKATKKYLGSKK